MKVFFRIALLLGLAFIVYGLLIRRADIFVTEWVWLVIFLLTLAIRLPYGRKSAAAGTQSTHADPSERAALLAFTLAVVTLPLLEISWNLFGFLDFNEHRYFGYVGIALQLPYLWLFWRAHRDLDVNWSPTLEIRPEHTLVTGGVYSTIRHPMYTAIWIYALSQPLLIPNLAGGLLAIPAFAWLYLTRIGKEERMMEHAFGDEYNAYMARTKRLIPGVL